MALKRNNYCNGLTSGRRRLNGLPEMKVNVVERKSVGKSLQLLCAFD